MIWGEASIRDRVTIRMSGNVAGHITLDEVASLIEEIDRLRTACRAACTSEADGRMRCWDYVELRKKEGVTWTKEMLDDCVCAACWALEGLPP